MFDTHCHLNLSEYFPNPEVEIIKAREAQVMNILIPGTNLKNSKMAIEIADTYERVYAAIGIHPTENLEEMDFEKVIFNLEELLLSSKNIVAVGEIGLDYYHLNTPAPTQIKFLKAQIKLALKHNKSIILHNRHSTEDMLKVLEEIGWNNLTGRVVFHCCEPNEDILTLVIKHNLFIGVDGDVTYDVTKANFIKKVPLSSLVLETDSPFLTPQPKKDGDSDNNCPANLIYIAKKIASLKKIEFEKVALITFQNSQKLFNISSY